MLTANTDDWMTTLLRSPVFQRLTPMNLQKVLLSLEQVEFNSGEIVIDQGTEGDYYYLIKTGRCLLTRKPTPLAKEVKIRELADGDTFGEDALITGGKRDLTITAVEHSVMLRLDKQRFITMIKEPVLAFVDSEQMYEAVAKNTSILLDVRTPEEYQNAHLPGSINRPFFALRMQIKSLDREKNIS